MKTGGYLGHLASVVVLWTTLASATYIGLNHKDNSVDQQVHHNEKRYKSFFKHDRDISRYTRLFGQSMMLWRCKNAIQPYWNWKPLKEVDLYCEVLGRIKAVEWYHNGKKIKIGGRIRQSFLPHYANHRFFSKWIDVHLRVYNATVKDSGVYTFRAVSPSGYSEKQVIYVDISEKKRKKKKVPTATLP